MTNTSLGRALLARVRLIVGGWVAVGLLAGGAACSSQSPDSTIRQAQRSGLNILTLRVPPFDLLLLGNQSPQSADGRLRVYLSGDGSPWRGNRVTADPGPQQPLALELMLKDPERSWLIGRPCYHRNLQSSGTRMPSEDTAGCDPSLWSFERYGERVLTALEGGLAQLIEKQGSGLEPIKVTLIGYSGGGALAFLLAQRVGAVDEVITVAAPLDVAAWTAYHSYTPLVGSIDPAQVWPRRPLRELHLQGKLDRQVPPATTQKFFGSATNTVRPTVMRVITETDGHHCCWAKSWPHKAVRQFYDTRDEGR